MCDGAKVMCVVCNKPLLLCRCKNDCVDMRNRPFSLLGKKASRYFWAKIHIQSHGYPAVRLSKIIYLHICAQEAESCIKDALKNNQFWLRDDDTTDCKKNCTQSYQLVKDFKNIIVKQLKYKFKYARKNTTA